MSSPSDGAGRGFLPASLGAVQALLRRAGEWGMTRAQTLYTVVGLWLGLAFVLALLALLGFVELAEGVVSGETQAFDHALMQWMGARSHPGWDGFFRSVTELGAGLVMVVMASLVSTFLWIQGQRRAVALLWIGLAGILLMDQGLKELFARERPTVFEWRTTQPSGYAFPSGHTLNATVGYTLFAFLLARMAASRRLQAAIFAVAALLIVGVALSRVYLGVHYPSDVIAGVLVGFAWAMACVFAVYVLGELRGGR